jgi:opacity protein-like surface antigen
MVSKVVLGLGMIFAAIGVAQPIGGGIKFGVPLNDAFNIHSPNPLRYVADTHRYTVGPYVEFRLPAGFAIEFDALYKSYEYRVAMPVPAQTSASSWEFPLMGKWKFIPGPVQPYFEAGAAYAHLTDVPSVVELNTKNNYGVVAGAGVELHLGKLRITPEVRYNGWARRFFISPGDYLTSNRNQATFLVGFGF